MVSYAQHFSTLATPQSQPIPGGNQVANSAGGFSFPVDDWKRLDRFLILGNEGGSYYAGERELTVQNAECVQRCLKADDLRTVRRIVEISHEGRAPQNDPAIFALAMAAGSADAATGALALESLPKVCRIGTHLFQFVDAVKRFRGFGRGLRAAIAKWYERDDIAYQVTKYQQRNGWSHRDLLRLCHADAGAIGRYVTHSFEGMGGVVLKSNRGETVLPPIPLESLPRLVLAFEDAKRADVKTIVQLIRDHGLTREHIPTQHLALPEVWEALLEKMPLTAMIRNLATMTRIGLIAPMSRATGMVCQRLADSEYLRKSRVHPIAVLAALKTYQSGRSVRGDSTWSPVAQIVDALDGAFYGAFGNVKPTGKRWMLALDVSGSMSGGCIAGITGLSPRVASAAMAMVIARTEPQHFFAAFSHTLVPLDISPRQRLDDVIRIVSHLPFGGTDCALPMLYAAEKNIPVDAFCVLTDSETWHGAVHPSQALERYRRMTGIQSKSIVCGMVANSFTIADPNDADSLDVVGFDTAVPDVMREFVAG